jgi:HAD superfamily hydrolase (TIGR01450 family)
VLLQRNRDALFVATNEDAFDLVGADARHLPGNGALVKALEHASQRNAINVGKPSAVLANLIHRQHNLDPSRTLMVGDRLDTDIRFGVEGGMVSALVLTGCTTANDLVALGKGSQEEPMPDVILPYMGLLA